MHTAIRICPAPSGQSSLRTRAGARNSSLHRPPRSLHNLIDSSGEPTAATNRIKSSMYRGEPSVTFDMRLMTSLVKELGSSSINSHRAMMNLAASSSLRPPMWLVVAPKPKIIQRDVNSTFDRVIGTSRLKNSITSSVPPSRLSTSSTITRAGNSPSNFKTSSFFTFRRIIDLFDPSIMLQDAC